MAQDIECYAILLVCANGENREFVPFRHTSYTEIDSRREVFCHGASWTVEVAKQRTFRPMYTDDFENEARELISMVHDASSGFDVDKRTVGPYADIFTIKRNFDKSGQYDVFHILPEDLR